MIPKYKTKISIVTITYNSEKTLERTIQSVVSQNYDNLEYWIIDGASKDNTMEIVKKYSSEYDFIKYVSEPDKGISDAFNKGVSKATGELIALINSDDQLADGALEAVNRVFTDTNADVIYGDTIALDIKNGLKLYKKAKDISQIKYDLPFIHQSCYIKKSVYNECGGYSDKYKICMDYDFLSKVFHRGFSFIYTPTVLSIFQYGGTSCEHPVRTINEDIIIAKKYGLSSAEAFSYKLKHIPINVAKIILSKLHIWGILYKVIKGKNSVLN